jgi:hypothetical protein
VTKIIDRSSLELPTDDTIPREIHDGLRAEIAKHEASTQRLLNIIAVVNEQAEDFGLWFDAVYATEAYLQQELRRLHSAIDGSINPHEAKP